MKHLTDEQLSALLDGALAARDLAECEAHLAACDACRARLAEAGALDESLTRSLEHDPGEAYFESFAERVAARIAAEGAEARVPSPAASPSRAFWRRFLSPGGLALSSSTVAILLVAGLAYMRFQDRGRTASDFHTAPPSPVGSTLRAPVTQNASPEEEQAPPPAATGLDERGDAVRSPDTPPPPARSRASRMQEVRKNDSGEDVPVAALAPPVADRDAGSATSPGRIKQRSAAPATGEPARQVAPESQALAKPAPSVLAPPPASAPLAAKNQATAARPITPAPSDELGRISDTREEDSQGKRVRTQALAPCGTVRDSRGRPVSGAQVMVVNDVTRTSRTGPDGTFCLSRLVEGDVVSVLRVGYEPVRLTVGDSAPLAVVMEPVGTLGPEAGKGLVTKAEPHSFSQEPAPTAASGSLALKEAKLAAPAADVYKDQSTTARAAATAAREAEGVALRENSAAAMDSAAVRWDRVAALVTGAAMHDARFRALSLRRQSMSAGPTPERVTRFRQGLAVFLAQAPRTLPEYATASRWQSELDTKNKSLYR